MLKNIIQTIYTKDKSVDWRRAIEAARLTDIDGDLSYTIHVNKAIQICEELEGFYFNLCQALLEKMKQVIKENSVSGKNDVNDK